jgi:hypothetical protein
MAGFARFAGTAADSGKPVQASALTGEISVETMSYITKVIFRAADKKY